MSHHMGLDVRKPVFGGLWTTQAQTSLRIHAVWSAPLLFAFWKVLYVNLLQVKFQSALKLACWKPWRQVLSRQGPYYCDATTAQVSLFI